MKRKIIIGLVVYSVVFLVGGVYIVLAFESSKSKLNQVILLHRVEILREHYLLQINGVQSTLLLRSTDLSGDPKPIDTQVLSMGRVMDTCFGCHHSKEVFDRLGGLKRQMEEYKAALARVPMIRPNSGRLLAEEKSAFGIGEDLTRKVSSMIATTCVTLEEKTLSALREISKTKNVLYLLMGFVPVIGSVAVFGVVKSLTDPIGVLLESTRKLKGGDLGHRLEGLKDEFEEIGTAFNEMAESLQEQMEQMREAKDKLAKANQELKLAQEQMVRADMMAALGTLSAGISHELSTPLSVILNLAQFLKQDAGAEPALLQDLETIEEEASQAIRITRSLLGFARATKSKRESVCLNRVLEDLLNILEFQPAAKTVRQVSDMDPELRTIRANAGQMRQVFLNVILNAIQAMPGGGELRIVTRNCTGDLPEGVEVIVSDTGVGIPLELRKKIFEPFFTTKYDGTGLGLAIVNGIIRDHDGRIDMESEAGKGTTFTIFLPAGGGQEAT
jgi:two-component system NtrC family sensor kinase